MGTAGGVDGHVQVGPAGPGLAHWPQPPSGSCHGRPRGAGAVGGQAGRRVGQRGHVPGQPRVQPRLADVGRVDRQALAQREARLGGVGGELVDVRPRALGVDVVRGQRGDAAPVVDAGPQDEVVLRADQVRRRLDAGLGAEDEPGHGDRRGQVIEFGVRHVAHLGVRLGPEVLHDDFLDAAVLARDLPDGEDRFGRSAILSPMPMRMPVVNGTLLRPAFEHAQPDGGSLSGLPKCGPPFSLKSLVAVVSSIMPMDGATGLRRWKSCQLSTPGLRCGSRPVSSSTRMAMACSPLAPAAVRFLPRQAARLGAVGGQAGRRVGQRGHVPGQPRVQPRLADVGRVDRQALAQREARLGGVRRELVDVRPRAFGVDVVRGQRGDAAPVVDAGPQDEVVLRADQVRRRLDAGLGAEDEPGHGDRRGQVIEFGVRHVAHLGVRLGPEVLHDDFLDAAVLARDLPDGEDRFGPFGQRLADADEDARGERDVAAAGVLEHAQPDGGVLVRAAEVRAAFLAEQPGRRRLEHHAHGRGDRLEALEVLPAQHARVEVRQQAGFLEHADGHGPHVGQGVVVAVRVQPVPGLVPAVLRLVAQGEQGLLAAQVRALAGDVEHLVRFQVQVVQPVRDGRERAVAAAVPAQPGQRDEDLAGVGDDAWAVWRPPGRRPWSGWRSSGACPGPRRGRAAGPSPRPGRAACRPGPAPASGAWPKA